MTLFYITNMILEENIIKYFEDMKLRGSIAQIWKYSHYRVLSDESIMVYYVIETMKENRRSSFKTKYEIIISYIREQKLKNILE
jgi:hypothetical protein